MDKQTLIERINDLRHRGKKCSTNCFYSFAQSDKTEWEVFSSSETLIIINEENMTFRVWFYSTDPEDLSQALKNCFPEKELVAEITSKAPDTMKNELLNGGFYELARMQRFSNGKISDILSESSIAAKYEDNSIPKAAVLSDAEDIYDFMWGVFDTRISHLPDKKQLCEAVENGEFTVYRNGSSRLTALLQAVVSKKSFYINQVINKDDSRIIHAIMISKLKEYIHSGGEYVYSWIEDTNIPSLKFHAKYGLKPDGLWNVVYVRSKK